VTANPGRSFGARPGPCWTRGPADVTREFEVSAQAIRNWVAQSDPPKGPGTRSVAALAAALFAASKAVVIHGSWGMVFLVFSLTRASRLRPHRTRPHTVGILDGGACHWAMAMTLIQTAKLNGVDSMAWLTDVLERVVSGRTKAHELHTLLPWNWTSLNSSTAAALAA
jgi:hypothetical protein